MHRLAQTFSFLVFYGVTALYHLRELKCHHAGCMHNATVRDSVSSPTIEYLYQTSDWILQWSLGFCCACDFLCVHNTSITVLKYLSHLEMTKSQGTPPSHDPKPTWQHIFAMLDTYKQVLREARVFVSTLTFPTVSKTYSSLLYLFSVQWGMFLLQ